MTTLIVAVAAAVWAAGWAVIVCVTRPWRHEHDGTIAIAVGATWPLWLTATGILLAVLGVTIGCCEILSRARPWPASLRDRLPAHLR